MKSVHCDERVVHAPRCCRLCDELAPELQQARIDSKTNFTGQNFEGLAPCPADKARGLGQAHRWPGNAPRFHNDAVFTDLEESWFSDHED